MTEWVKVGGAFIQGDDLRWTEPVFERRGARGQRLVLSGERVVTAQVLKEPDRGGWALFVVVGCVVGISRIPRRVLIPLKAGVEIKRAYKTIVKGSPERRLWSDESARALLASAYLGEKQHRAWMEMETDEDYE